MSVALNCAFSRPSERRFCAMPSRVNDTSGRESSFIKVLLIGTQSGALLSRVHERRTIEVSLVSLNPKTLNTSHIFRVLEGGVL